jgi:hypothetical protein
MANESERSLVVMMGDVALHQKTFDFAGTWYQMVDIVYVVKSVMVRPAVINNAPFYKYQVRRHRTTNNRKSAKN